MYPDLSEIAAKEVFKSRAGEKGREKGTDLFSFRENKSVPFSVAPTFMDGTKKLFSKLSRSKSEVRNIRIGIPRTLNMYSVAPFFIAYFENAGVPYKNIILSDYTDEKMYKEGSRRGAIDACFPSKVALSHMHNLIYN